MTNNLGFINVADYDAYLDSLSGKTVEIDTMGGALIISQKLSRLQRWLADVEKKLASPNDLTLKEVDKLSSTKEFILFEIAVLKDEVGGPISRWWNRLHLSGVEYGRVEDGNALDTSFLQSDELDGGSNPIFETNEQDGEWWEDQFSKPSGLTFTTEEGERVWMANWDHLNKVAQTRDSLAAQLAWEVSKAKTVRDLVRITKWAGLWSWHAQQRNNAKKGCIAKANTYGIDFARYASICNQASQKACTMKGFTKGAEAIAELSYSNSEEEEEVKEQLAKLRPWLSKKVSPALKVFGIKIYQNEVETEESEDILDRGSVQGEFCADAEFALINKVTVELAMEETIKLFDEARRRMTQPPVTSFRMTESEILDWLGESVRPLVATPKLTFTLGDILSN